MPEEPIHDPQAATLFWATLPVRAGAGAALVPLEIPAVVAVEERQAFLPLTPVGPEQPIRGMQVGLALEMTMTAPPAARAAVEARLQAEVTPQLQTVEVAAREERRP